MDNTHSTKSKIIVYEDNRDDFIAILDMLAPYYQIVPETIGEWEMVTDRSHEGKDVANLIEMIRKHYKDGLKLILFDLFYEKENQSRCPLLRTIREFIKNKGYENQDFKEFCALVPIIAYSGKSSSSDALDYANLFISKKLKSETIDEPEKHLNLLTKKIDGLILEFENNNKMLGDKTVIMREEELFRLTKRNKTAFIMCSFSESVLTMAAHVKTILSYYGINAKIANAPGGEHTNYVFTEVTRYIELCDFGIAIYSDETENSTKPILNPNVSMEIGYMLGLGKKVIIIEDLKGKPLPGDFEGFITIKYSASLKDDLVTKLKNERLLVDKSNLIF